jgi:5-formyltetrahydrofolate cyclo-ligase
MKTDRDIELSKKKLRKRIISLRDSVSENLRDSRSRIIALKLFEIEYYKNAECILLFYSFGSEISTRSIIDNALSDSKRIMLPRIKDKNIIETYFIANPEKDLQSGYFGIMEPVPERCKKASPKEADLAIIPGVCFDRNLNRLGYGGGFYDRIIPELNKEVLKISLCFDMQVIENVPVSDYDMKIDMIITEKEILIN